MYYVKWCGVEKLLIDMMDKDVVFIEDMMISDNLWFFFNINKIK